MKVSVVIPVYNEEQYIKNCLTSLKNQIEPAEEIIVVDNNCTDGTTRLVKKFNVRLITEKKQGIIYARNLGYNMAKHEIIARCDGDVILPVNWIKKIKENFKNKKIDGLGGLVSFYDGCIPFFLIKLYFFLLRKVLGHYPLIGSNTVLTKKIWQKIKDEVCLDDKKVHEDVDLSIHINKAGGKIAFDQFLIVGVSARRIKYNPLSFFVEYPIRLIKTLKTH